MHLWIDNTGLHGAGRCLVADAKSGYDIKGLLQLATLLVFADSIEFGDFESAEIANASADYRKILLDIGVDGTALAIRTKSRDEYALACRAAAEFGSEELRFQFRADERLILGFPETKIPRAAQFNAQRTQVFATMSDDSEVLAGINETALDHRGSGAIDYMVSGSAPLRMAIRQLIEAEPVWLLGHTFQVESMLRAYLNDQLARQVGAAYAPAAHRADLVSRQNQWLLEQLGSALDPIVNELRSEPLGIPSVTEALLRKAGGEPRAVIREALAFRERAGDLRKSLFELQQLEAKADPASQHRIRKEVADLARGVRIDLGLESPWDALTIQGTLGLPPSGKVSMPVKALIDWLKFRWSKGRRAVLTDLVLTAAFSGVDPSVYRKLLTRSVAANVAIESIDLPRLR